MYSIYRPHYKVIAKATLRVAIDGCIKTTIIFRYKKFLTSRLRLDNCKHKIKLM